MKKIDNSTNPKVRPDDSDLKKENEGYPLYSETEDIYNKYREEKDINPEETTKDKDPNEEEPDGSVNGGDLTGGKSGSNLDVPGSELDDNQEEVGSEDEENNYYSLGGDNHSDLDENQGDL